MIKKTRWNSGIWNFFSEKINLAYILLKIDIFRSATFVSRHCDVIRWPIFMILLSMERGDPTLYYGTKQLYFGRVNFKSTGGGTTLPKKAQEDEG